MHLIYIGHIKFNKFYQTFISAIISSFYDTTFAAAHGKFKHILCQTMSLFVHSLAQKFSQVVQDSALVKTLLKADTSEVLGLYWMHALHAVLILN